MDPISLVVTAVALGASAGLKDTAAQMVKDAYAGVKGLKTLLTGRGVDVSALERRPDSDTQRAALAETLTDTGDVVDDEVVAAAQAVTEAVAAHEPAAAAAIGVDLERARAGFLRIASVDSAGTGVRVRDGEFTGGIDIGQVRAGVDSPGVSPEESTLRRGRTAHSYRRSVGDGHTNISAAAIVASGNPDREHGRAGRHHRER